MIEWTAIALRFAVYANLLFLFGIAAYPFYGGDVPFATRRVIAGTTLASLAFCVAAFLSTAAAMSGTNVAALDRETLWFVTSQTDMGIAFVVRAAALVLAVAAAFSARSQALVLLFVGLAVSTLAWTGHAAATEGVTGQVHRVSDIMHLLAAGVWLGALVVLGRQLFEPMLNAIQIAATAQALKSFALAGTVIVAILVTTGTINLLSIVGPEGLPRLWSIQYGLLFATKIALFALMLCLAAVNRWQLTPKLSAAREDRDLVSARRHLRISLILELSLALGVLIAVAWLGTLDPTGAS